MKRNGNTNDRKEDDFELDEKDFRSIFGSEWSTFEKKIITNCYCGNCVSDYNSTIIDYKILLNDLNDLILHGKCADCGKPIGRYVETGENEEYTEIIEAIKKRYSKN